MNHRSRIFYLVSIIISLNLIPFLVPGRALSSGRRGDKFTLTILDFTNRNQDPRWRGLSRGLADMLITNLSQTGRITVVERERMQEIMDELDLRKGGVIDKKSADLVGRAAKVKKALFGGFEVEGGELKIETHLVDIRTGKLERVEWVTGKTDELCTLIHDLSVDIVKRLNITLTPEEAASLYYCPTGSLDAVGHYYLGLEEVDNGQYIEAITQFQDALKKDSGYFEPRFQMAKTYRKLGESRHGLIELDKIIAGPYSRVEIERALLEAGRIYEEDLKDDRQALIYYERLIDSHPEMKLSPGQLVDKYFPLAQELKTLWDQISVKRFLELQKIGKRVSPEARKEFKEIVTGFFKAKARLEIALYRAAGCYQRLGDTDKAFLLLEKHFELLRWLTHEDRELNLKGFKYKDAGATELIRLYDRLLKEGNPPKDTPPWALVFDPEEPVIKGMFTDKERYRYGLKPLHAYPYGKYFLQAPPGLQIDKLITRASAGIKCVPAFYGLRFFNLEIMDDINSPKYVLQTPALDHYAHSATISTERSEEVTLPEGTRYILMRVFDGASTELKDWEVRAVLSPFIPPAKKVEEDKIEKKKTELIIQALPFDLRLFVDGEFKDIPPDRDGEIRLELEPGEHQIRLEREGLPELQDKVILEENSELYLIYDMESNWDRGYEYFIKGKAPDYGPLRLLQDSKGEYRLFYMAREGARQNLYTITSQDLINWSQPVPLSVNSNFNDWRPQVFIDEQGIFRMAWWSDRPFHRDDSSSQNYPKKRSLWYSSSPDGLRWDPPQRIPTTGLYLEDYISFFQDSKGIYRLYYIGGEKYQEDELRMMRSLDGQSWEAGPAAKSISGYQVGILDYTGSYHFGTKEADFIVEIDPGRFWLLCWVREKKNHRLELRESGDGINWGEARTVIAFPDNVDPKEEYRFRSAGVTQYSTRVSYWPMKDASGRYIISGERGGIGFYITSLDGMNWSDPVQIRWLQGGSRLLQDDRGRYIGLNRIGNRWMGSPNLRSVICQPGKLHSPPIVKFRDPFSEKVPGGDMWSRNKLFDLNLIRGEDSIFIDSDNLWVYAPYSQLGSAPKNALYPENAVKYEEIMPAILPVRDIKNDPDGIWVASGSTGFYHQNRRSGEWEHIGAKSGLNSELGLCLAVDGDMLWLGTAGGLNQYDRGEKKVVAIYTEKEGLPSNWIHSLAADGDNLYIGTEKGMAVLDKKSGFIKKYNYRDFLCDKDYSPEDLDRDRDTTLFRQGIVFLNYGQVRDIEVDSDSVWIMAGGLSRFDKKTKKWERIFDSLFTRDIASDDRFVWLATDKGLYSYEKESGKIRSHPFSRKIDKPYQRIDSIALDGDDLWFCSESIIYRKKKSTLVKAPDKNGDESDQLNRN